MHPQSTVSHPPSPRSHHRTNNNKTTMTSLEPLEEQRQPEDGWEELMGKDILMKLSPETCCDEENFRDFQRKDQPDVGDAVCLDWDVYCIGKDPQSQESYLCISDDIIHKTSDIQPIFSVSGWIITVGDGDLPPAFELASRYLKLHTVAWVLSHSKYAYGQSGRLNTSPHMESGDYSIPPFSTILFCIKNRGIASSTCSLFHEPKFILKRAEYKKIIGNHSYQYEWIDHGGGKNRALKLYGSTCEAMIHLLRDLDQNAEDNKDDDPTANFDSSSKQEAVQLLVDCFNNIAAFHLRDKAYGKAKEAAANALRYNPENRKALQRAARAAMLDPSGTYEESDLAISVLEELEPHDEETKKLRHELQRRKKDYKKREKEMYSRMVKGISKDDEEDKGVCLDETNRIHEAKEDQLDDHPASTKEGTRSECLSYRYMALSMFVHVGVIALLWWLFPGLREKFVSSNT